MSDIFGASKKDLALQTVRYSFHRSLLTTNISHNSEHHILIRLQFNIRENIIIKVIAQVQLAFFLPYSGFQSPTR